MEQSRREFLRRSAAILLLASLSGCEKLIRAAGSLPAGERILIPAPGLLSVFDTNTKEITEIPTTLRLAHYAAVNPANPNRVVIFEQEGPKACEIDLAEKRVVRTITLPADRKFYGHGVFFKDVFFATEGKNEYPFNGEISIRRASDMQVIDKMPSYGLSPHDMALVNGGKTLAVVNNGKPIGYEPRDLESSVVYIDMDSKRLIHKVPIAEKNIYAGHLAAEENGDVYVVTRSQLRKKGRRAEEVEKLLRDPLTRELGVKQLEEVNQFLPAPPMFASLERDPVLLKSPEIRSHLLQSLSAALSRDGNTVGVTHPGGHIATFWDFHKEKLKKSVDFSPHKPMGIAFIENDSLCAVSLDNDTIRFLDVATLSPANRPALNVKTGSHLSKA